MLISESQISVPFSSDLSHHQHQDTDKVWIIMIPKPMVIVYQVHSLINADSAINPQTKLVGTWTESSPAGWYHPQLSITISASESLKADTLTLFFHLCSRWVLLYIALPFGALTSLAEHQEGHQTCEYYAIYPQRSSLRTETGRKSRQ